MMRYVILAIVSYLALMSCPKHAIGQALPLELLKESSRIVFLGDSITYNGQYVARFETWLLTRQLKNDQVVINVGLPSETVSGLSEEGHAGGKFPRPDLAERLDRVLEQTRPDLVFACYGINCGIYQPFDETRFEKFCSGIQSLADRVEFSGAKLVILTPPTYDDSRVERGFSYDDVMKRYAAWIIEKGGEEDWNVVDLHTPMTAALAEMRGFRPDFSFQPDGVHPDKTGHFVMASALIKSFDPDYSPTRSHEIQMVQQMVENRLAVRRDAWLTATGHSRPGLEKGLTIEEAEKRADGFSRFIDTWIARKVADEIQLDR